MTTGSPKDASPQGLGSCRLLPGILRKIRPAARWTRSSLSLGRTGQVVVVCPLLTAAVFVPEKPLSKITAQKLCCWKYLHENEMFHFYSEDLSLEHRETASLSKPGAEGQRGVCEHDIHVSHMCGFRGH